MLLLEHSAILLTSIKQWLVLKTIFWCSFEWKLKTGFTVHHILETSICGSWKYKMSNPILFVSMCMGKFIRNYKGLIFFMFQRKTLSPLFWHLRLYKSWGRCYCFGLSHTSCKYNQLGENCIQIFIWGVYHRIYGRKSRFTAPLMRPSPNENFEYCNPHSNELLQFYLHFEHSKLHEAAAHLTECFRQYITGYTVAKFWPYPIRRRVTKASALE